MIWDNCLFPVGSQFQLPDEPDNLGPGAQCVKPQYANANKEQLEVSNLQLWSLEHQQQQQSVKLSTQNMLFMVYGIVPL